MSGPESRGTTHSTMTEVRSGVRLPQRANTWPTCNTPHSPQSQEAPRLQDNASARVQYPANGLAAGEQESHETPILDTIAAPADPLSTPRQCYLQRLAAAPRLHYASRPSQPNAPSITSRAWRFAIQKVSPASTIVALIISVVFGAGAWVGMNYANSFAQKGYQLALFGVCHEYEDVKDTTFCKEVVATGIEPPERIKRHLDTVINLPRNLNWLPVDDKFQLSESLQIAYFVFWALPMGIPLQKWQSWSLIIWIWQLLLWSGWQALLYTTSSWMFFRPFLLLRKPPSPIILEGRYPWIRFCSLFADSLYFLISNWIEIATSHPSGFETRYDALRLLVPRFALALPIMIWRMCQREHDWVVKASVLEILRRPLYIKDNVYEKAITWT